ASHASVTSAATVARCATNDADELKTLDTRGRPAACIAAAFIYHPTTAANFVAWSDCAEGDFSPKYWNELWGWYEAGGYAHVTASLFELDISAFDPKAPAT